MYSLILAVALAFQVNPLCGQEPAQETPPAVPRQSLSVGEWNLSFYKQTVDNDILKLTGLPGVQAEIEDGHLLFRADEIQYDRNTGIVTAAGRVFYHNFDRNLRIWCDHLEYDTEEKNGKFYEVTGEAHPHIVAKPGVLTTNNPFHFEGQWAERIGEKYILHQGFITNCKMPKPWWRLRGKTFNIVPGESAVTHGSTFILHKVPILYLPYFYHSLERESRKSGFLMPMPGHSSRRGMEISAGYFWAINRSYDITYAGQYYPSRGLVSHVDFRGKPRAGTDYDVIVFGANDKGAPNSGNPPQKYSGASILAVGKSDLGHGWTAHGGLNYLSSFRFRQEWSESYSEITGSEIHSVGFVNKNWSSYTLDTIFARLENFQSAEKPLVDPVNKSTSYLTNAVIIRKLPEAEFSGRDRAIFKNLPLWFSFESSAGLLYRSQPVFNGDTLIDTFQTGQFMNRSSISPAVTGAFHWAGIHLVPSFGIQETYYGEAQAPYLDRYRTVGTNIVRSTREFSLDIVLPSLARVFDKETIFGDKLKHVIEPRATYRYVTGIGEDYIRFIRFDENDIKSNTNELLLGLTNRIYAKRGDSVQEIFTWDLFQKRYFDPTFGGALIPGRRNLFTATADLTAYAFLVGPRSTSPVVSLLRASPVNGLGVQWQADYDHRLGRITDNSISVDYRFSKYFLQVGQNSVNPDPGIGSRANELHFRGSYGDLNHKGISVGFEGIYDYRTSTLKYTTSQITYNTNCCGFSFQLHSINLGTRVETVPRFAFAIANIATTLGNLKKQDRMF
ncbi:MAG TPA: LPS assembly protein LptD [Candidatus Solibacter sp.]|nr:LPS assembly protein LptD [Candidatus Solibacter sp.]